MNKGSITLAGGCFWCIEAIYSSMQGVISAVSGYANGNTINPTYKAVCGGDTGYAEAVKVEFNKDMVSLNQILDVFWHIHNPTTVNCQGADMGTQYRSGIYYEDESQKEAITASLEKAKEIFSAPIVTEVKSLKNWYEAEKYHQNYFANNPHQGYCMAVIAPKVAKLKSTALQMNIKLI